MKTYFGNYLGLVVDDRDPQDRGRVKVFIPHVMPALYEDWNKEGADVNFTIVDGNTLAGLNPIIVDRLQKILPWAECAAPIFGAGPAGKLNYADGTMSSGVHNVSNKTFETPQEVAQQSNAFPIQDGLDSQTRAAEAVRKGLLCSVGMCARGSNNILSYYVFGKGMATSGADARSMGPFLQERYKMTVVPNTGVYQNGDTKILTNNSNPSLPGHMETYMNGKWYSDHAQKGSLEGQGYTLKALYRLPSNTMAQQSNPSYTGPTWGSSAGMNTGQGPTNTNASVGYASTGIPTIDYAPARYDLPRLLAGSAEGGKFSYVPINEDKGRLGFGSYPNGSRAGTLKNSGGMYFSLHNNSTTGGDNYNPSIVIPSDASTTLKTQAQNYVNAVASYMNASGKFNVNGNVLVNGSYGRTVNNNVTFLETINMNSQKQVDFWYGSEAGLNAHADIISKTLGTVPGAVFGLPHGGYGGKSGAAAFGSSEEDLATKLYPYLIAKSVGAFDPNTMSVQGKPDQNPSMDVAANAGINTNSDPSKEPISVQNGVSFGGGNATKYNKERNEVGSTGENFNSNNPNIGTFPWILAGLAQQRPDLVSQGYIKEITRADDPAYFDNTRKGWAGPVYTIKKPLYAQFSYNGKTYGALLNDVGSAYGQQNVEGSSRLFDINYNGSLPGLLGIPDPNNLKGVTNFSILGGYAGQKLNEIGAADVMVAGTTPATAPAESTAVAAETASLPVIPNPNPNPTVFSQNTNYMPTGMFGSARAGQIVWVFFQEGNPLFPVYFAASYGEKEWKNIKQASSPDPIKNLEDPYQGVQTTLSLDAGGLASRQIISGQPSGFEKDEFAFEVFGKNGSALTFTFLATLLNSKYDFRQNTLGDAHYITGGHREDRTTGDHNIFCEQDLIFTVGNWTQEALDAASEIQKVIDEAMKAAKDTYEA